MTRGILVAPTEKICPRCGVRPRRRITQGRRTHAPYCKPCMNEYQKGRGYQQRWQERNPEKRNEVLRKSRSRHRERVRAEKRRWYYRHREEIRTRAKERYVPETGGRKARHRNRRAREKGALGHATERQIQARVDFYGGRCWMCGNPWQHIDHVIALSAGGSHWPANLRPACASCNIGKGAKHWREVS